MKPYFINLCDKLFEILEDKSTPMRIRKLRSDALLQLWRYAEKLERTTSIRKDLFDITFGKEEELIYWAIFTPNHHPGPEAIQRYITVFDRYYQANPA